MIGIFDSGHGGLTILRAQVDRLRERSFIYYGDHAHIPYGNRSSAEIVQLTQTGVARLFDQGCRLVILACNSAAAVALRTLQQTWLPVRYPDRRILGVLVPTVEAITGVPWHVDTSPLKRTGHPRTVTVFATPRTVASNPYPEEVVKRAPDITVVQYACPGLVDLIERGAPQEELRGAIDKHVSGLMTTLAGDPPDDVILGCTHYPLIADLFASALPESVQILPQPKLAADSLADYVDRRPEYDQPNHPREIRFLTTGNAAEVSRFAPLYFGREAIFESTP